MGAPLFELLPEYGPWLLFGLAILETCFVTGLVVPSGLATSAATVFALEGRMELAPVVLAAFAGGGVGDSLGFWIGRGFGEHVLRDGNRWSRLLGERRAVVEELFARHPAYSVTMARLISFVRTVMPMAAGMSDLSYRRYLPYELVGLTGWVVLYVTIGLVARESWEVATRVVGVGGTVVFAVVGLVAWRVWRGRVRRARASVPETGLDAAPDAGSDAG
jgi:membrane protein DedA with SNARE-associated domain